MRVLILGGTTEASAIAGGLATGSPFEVTLSLAGRTAKPVLANGVTTRSGGFGGPEGLARWLADNQIDAVIDATHPFAAQISANATAATGTLGLPLCTVVRPPWTAMPGDRWETVSTLEDAATALGDAPRRVFLSVGRQNIGAFQSAPSHAYVIRTIDPPEHADLPPDATVIESRGPFAIEDELDLLARHLIDVVVTKNAGGKATYAKIAAARQLQIPVVVIERPIKAGRHTVPTAADARLWLDTLHENARSERGV